MTWIRTISYNKANTILKKLYDRVRGPEGHIDNILKVHSLRPHTLTGHMALYKNVLHNTNNTLPKWYLETIGTYVSHLNACDYCIDHHFTGLKRLLNNDVRSHEIKQAIVDDNLESVFNGRFGKPWHYIKTLTMEPWSLDQQMVEALKGDFDDGEILEINQVVSYFCYANRTVLGLGVNTDGDVLGLSPNESDDPNNWGHQ